MELLLNLWIPLIPLALVWLALRHGPVQNRWWRGENPPGFALFVGGTCFALGFFGPMIFAPEANQGPMLGIFYTGPLGFVLGVVWGLWRAFRRGRWNSLTRI